MYEGPKNDLAAPYRRGFSTPLFFQLPCSFEEAPSQLPAILGSDIFSKKEAKGSEVRNDNDLNSAGSTDVLDAMMILPPAFDPNIQ